MKVTVKDQTANHNGVQYPAPGIGDGEQCVDLVWQYWDDYIWATPHSGRVNHKEYRTRQIFVLKEVSKAVSELHIGKLETLGDLEDKFTEYFLCIGADPVEQSEKFKLQIFEAFSKVYRLAKNQQSTRIAELEEQVDKILFT